ncbi:MAG TPA: hypothetical protein VLZ11_08750 [Flavobacterium sp.]|nr:hypothetical protein [Flavobacterium sp.]
METNTVLLIVFAFVIAFGLSWFQYFYKSKSKRNSNKLLFSLRLLSLFGLLLLLINPKITSTQYEHIKTPLVVAVDNSRSIKELQQDALVLALKDKITVDARLRDKFDVRLYRFDAEAKMSEDFDFDGNQTRIDKLAKNTAAVFKNTTFPTILLTDGNQTQGSDYIYAFADKNIVYPMVLGDTIVHFDLKINQLNANKYAFYKNKFPVEIFLGYQGDKDIEADFSIKQGEQTLFKQKVNFSKDNSSQVVSALLEASKVGVMTYQAVITSAEKEKNTYNNIKNFAVEVIDQKTEVVLISGITHPDLGVLKRSIETNEQNKLTIVSPSDISSLAEYDVVLVYQPTNFFQKVFDELKKSDKNYFVITGKHTDFNFLSRQQEVFGFRPSMQKEDFLAAYNSGFSVFAQEDIGFEDFPPLENLFGNLEIKQNIQTLLDARIRSINTEKPLLFFAERQQQRMAVLLGEGIWKWRLSHYSKTESFEDFDLFINKIIRYLATDNKRKSLVVNHERFYNPDEDVQITAQYFNKNYEFDQDAKLSLILKNTTTNESKAHDLLLSHNYYKANLNGLSPGNYSFVLKESTSNTVYNGSFEVIDFDIEKQYSGANYTKLQLLAQNTGGKVFFENQLEDLISQLLQNDQFKAVEKQRSKKLPLIDFWVLLGVIIAFLSLEWLVRKYNGLL